MMDKIKEKVTWVVLTDKKKLDSDKAAKEAIDSIKSLNSTSLKGIEKEFKKLSAQARINLFAQLLEGLYNICNLPDYIKTGILFNTASIHNIHNQVRQGLLAPLPKEEKDDFSYVG